MKERGIIFSTELIPKIMDGTKTQTRRVIKPQPQLTITEDTYKANIAKCPELCPYGQVGDRLWVKEAFYSDSGDVYYKAEWENVLPCAMVIDKAKVEKWQPSIFMPRWASRIDLEITEVRAERLQDISPHKLSTTNLEREGLPWKNRFGKDFTTELERYVLLEDFKELWDSLNIKRGYGWDFNPWVWVIRFRRQYD